MLDAERSDRSLRGADPSVQESVGPSSGVLMRAFLVLEVVPPDLLETSHQRYHVDIDSHHIQSRNTMQPGRENKLTDSRDHLDG